MKTKRLLSASLATCVLGNLLLAGCSGNSTSASTSVDPAAARDKTWGWVPWWGATLFFIYP